MKKIAIVTSSEFPACEGVGTYTMSIARAAIRNGWQVTIISRSYISNDLLVLKSENLRFLKFKTSRFPILNNIVFAKKLNKYFTKNAFDVINIQTPLVGFKKPNLCKAKIIATVHSTMKFDTTFIELVSIKALLNKIAGLTYSPIFESFLFKEADKIICVSEEVRDEVSSYNKEFLKKTSVIPNCIDFESFKKVDISRKKIITCIGRIGYRKGIMQIVEAVLNIKHKLLEEGFIVNFVGHGPLLEDLNRFIERNELNKIVKVFSVAQEEVPQLLSESMFTLMASTYETGPRVVLEAMSCGTPVIATKVGLLRGFPDNIYIKIDETAALSIENKILSSISMSSKKYHELSESCFQYVKTNHDIDKIWDKYEDVF